MGSVCVNTKTAFAANIILNAKKISPQGMGYLMDEERFLYAISNYINLVNLSPESIVDTEFLDAFSELDNDIFGTKRSFNPISHRMMLIGDTFKDYFPKTLIIEDSFQDLSKARFNTQEQFFTIKFSDDEGYGEFVKVRITPSDKTGKYGKPHVVGLTFGNINDENSINRSVHLFSNLFDLLKLRLNGDFRITVDGSVNSDNISVNRLMMLLPAVGFQVVDEIQSLKVPDEFKNMFIKFNPETLKMELYSTIPVFGYKADYTTSVETMEDADLVVLKWIEDSEHVTRDDNHIYYINGIAPDQASISKLGKESQGKTEETDRMKIGTLVDANARYILENHFIKNNGVWTSSNDLSQEFENGNITTPSSFYLEMQRFTTLLSLKYGEYGKDWKILANPPYIYMDETYNDGDTIKKRTRFGEMDFVVYTKDGLFIIIDMKTSKLSADKLKEYYSSQLNGYKTLFSQKYGIDRGKISMFIMQFNYDDNIDGHRMSTSNGKFIKKINDFLYQVLDPRDREGEFKNQFKLAVLSVNENSQISPSEMKLEDVLISIDDYDLGIEFSQPNLSNYMVNRLHKNLAGEKAMVSSRISDTSIISGVERNFLAKAVGDLFAHTVRRLSTEEDFFNKTRDILNVNPNISFTDIKNDVKALIKACAVGKTKKLASGTRVIMDYVRQQYFNPEAYDQVFAKEAYDAIKVANEDFDALIVLANPILTLTTGIYISGVNTDGSIEINNEELTEEQINQANELYDELEIELTETGSKDMNFSLQVQNVSAIQNMTAKMRSIFETIAEVDEFEDGQRCIRMHDKFFKIPVFMNSTSTIDKILRLVSGSEDSDVMFHILEVNKETYPFIKQILSRIGNDAELKRNFWNAFSRSFNSMMVINSKENEDGTIKNDVIPTNEKSTNLYYSNSTRQLFNGSNPEIVIEAYEDKGEIYVKKKIKGDEISELKEQLHYIKECLKPGGSWKTEAYNKESNEFDLKLVQNLGHAISDFSAKFGQRIDAGMIIKQIKLSFEYNNFKKLNDLIENLENIYKSPNFKLSFIENIYSKIDKIIDEMPVGMLSRESMTKEGGKGYYSYIPDSYIERRITKLTDSINRSLPSNKIHESDSYIDREFGRSYMLNPDYASGITPFAKFRIPWINWLYENDSHKEILKKFYIPLVDKTEFSKMGDIQYALSFIAMYSRGRDLQEGYREATYTVPLYSNKGVYEAVRAFTYTRGYYNFVMNNINTFKQGELFDYKDKISEDFLLLARYEIDRMKTFLARKFDGSEIDSINGMDIGDFDGINDIKQRYLSGKITADDIKTIIQSTSSALGFNTTPWLNAIFGIDSRGFTDYLEENWEEVKKELNRFDKLSTGLSSDSYDSYDSFLKDVGDIVVNEFTRKNDESSNTNFSKLDSLLFVLNKFGMENQVNSDLLEYNDLGVFERIETKSGKETIKGKYKYLDQYLHFNKGEENSDEYAIDGIEYVEEFLWNDYLAKHNIILLTSGDTSQYGNMMSYSGITNFFKRNAQAHSPINKVDKAAVGTFFDGEKFSQMKVSKDGKLRYGIIQDETLMSEFGAHLKSVAKSFFESLSNMSAEEKRANIEQFSKIADKYIGGTNYTDSQAFNCPTSFAKKMQALGVSWTEKHQKAYERMVRGVFVDGDSDVLYEIMKNFSFSNKWISSGLESDGRGFSEIPISMQNKNSEYLITLFGAIARNQNQKLRAIYDFMEMSHHTGQKRLFGIITKGKMGKYNGLGIDTFEFVSASKDAPYGAVDLSGLTTYSEVMDRLQEWFYDGKEMVPENYNPIHVQEIEMDDYGKQTSMIEHSDRSKLEPSQERVIIHGDIMEDENLEVSGEKMKAGDAIKEYERLQAENIDQDADKLAEELGAVKDSNGKVRRSDGSYDFSDGSVLRQKLARIITKSQQSRLQSNQEILMGLEVNDNGSTVIPMGEIAQTAIIQQMAYAVIKTNVNKQKKTGGAALQISTFGFENDLSIVFTDENGNRLMNLKEYFDTNYARDGFRWEDSQFSKVVKRGNKLSPESKAILDKYYEYINSNNPKFSHYEVFMKCPWSSKVKEDRFFYEGSRFLSVQEIRQKINDNPDAAPMTIEDFEKSLEIIASRVPFESLYSCFPCKIKDWLPETAGMAMAFPKEATLISGFDFDGDKAHYTMREFDYSNEEGQKRYSFNEYVDGGSRTDRNNRIFDLKLGFMRAKSSTVRMLSPGSFEDQKRLKYIVGIARELVNEKTGKKYTLDELNKMSTKQLENLYNSIDMGWDVASSLTQIRFHRVNSSAQVNIGGTANNNTSHAMLTHADVKVLFGKADSEISYYVNGNQFTHPVNVFGINLTSPEGIKLDPIFSFDKNYSSRILANFLDAFVDTSKESVGEELNVNSATLNIMCSLARMGFTKDQIAFFLTQPILEEMTRRYYKGDTSKKSFTGVAYIARDLYNEKLESISKNKKEQENAETQMWNVLNNNDITVDSLFDRISDNMDKATSDIFDLAILKLFMILNNKSKAINTITKITQCNSIRNAPGPEYIDLYLFREEIKQFLEAERDPKTANFINAEQVFDNEIVRAFYENTIADGRESTASAKNPDNEKLGKTSLAEQISRMIFIESTNSVKSLIDVFSSKFKYLPSRDTINYLVRDFIYFNAIERGVFKSDRDTRNFFINEFSDAFNTHDPKVFRGEIVNDEQLLKQAWKIIEDNKFIGNVIYKNKNSKNKLELSELVISFADETDPTVRQDIISSIEDLITSENKYVKAFAKNMIMYMIMKNGLNFSNLTAFTSLSARTKLELDNLFVGENSIGYLDLFDPSFYDDADSYYERFFDLFFRNRYYLDGVMKTVNFSSSRNKFSHEFSDSNPNLVTISASSMDDMYYLQIGKKKQGMKEHEIFVPYFKDWHDNLYRRVDGSFREDKSVSEAGKKETKYSIQYEKVKPLSIRYHYIQYFSQGELDLENVLGGKTMTLSPEENVSKEDQGNLSGTYTGTGAGTETPGTTNIFGMLKLTATKLQLLDAEEKIKEEDICTGKPNTTNFYKKQ